MCYGVHVNDDSQVCTDDDQPIAGLFAAGNCQGDFFGFNYPVHCPGCSTCLLAPWSLASSSEKPSPRTPSTTDLIASR